MLFEGLLLWTRLYLISVRSVRVWGTNEFALGALERRALRKVEHDSIQLLFTLYLDLPFPFIMIWLFLMFIKLI